MKKFIFLIVISVLIFDTAVSQRRKQNIKWFSLAAKAGIGNSMFLNKDIANDESVNLNYLTLSQSYGGRFTFTFGDNLGFGAELLFSSFGQKYDIKNSDDTNMKNLKFKSVDFIPFFRYTGNNSAYVEIGAKFSSINSITETNSNSIAIVRNDLMNNYETKFTSPVLGFGIALYKTDRIDINLGARFAYSLTDISPDKTFNAVSDNFYIADYQENAATNPFSAQAILEVNYFFAFWGDSSCGRGRLMLFN
jgi:hypothetical protein